MTKVQDISVPRFIFREEVFLKADKIENS